MKQLTSTKTLMVYGGIGTFICEGKSVAVIFVYKLRPEDSLKDTRDYCCDGLNGRYWLYKDANTLSGYCSKPIQNQEIRTSFSEMYKKIFYLERKGVK
jgi:hypothetical protein